MSKSTISSLFGGASPFTSLQQHMRHVLTCVREMPSFIDAVILEEQDKVELLKEKIFTAENDADRAKNGLRDHLPKSLFMPVDRRDLLAVLTTQDSIADVAQDIAGLFIERPMSVPEPMQKLLVELTNSCVDVCEHYGKIVEELDELVEMGFRGHEAERVEKMLEQLNLLEDKTDDQGIELTQILHRNEQDIDPVSVMLWRQIIEWIGDLADNAEKSGDRLRLLIAR
ncbi:MAG: TIGR00153 family protein [Thiotrichales bacterium]|jgi:hypothetical protein|nr:TIGR00153 family protein [Thiotrichales bacterium]MBT3613101.1 TIGR00153 family protein [Thiotrichales bacterium]MBT3752144.1 TIGR00153 family protein [Thiotrichales bacterium]MBT3837816.1 TIGR00153 family protein [Thiotrichales bacterium]MBT4152769.1 TIGR00153 family protein [Thiotrichales bacterium]